MTQLVHGLLITAMTGAATAPPGLEDALGIIDLVETTPIEVAYDDLPVAVVVAELGDRLPASVAVDWEALEQLGVLPDDRISLEVRGQDGLTVLSALMLELGDEFAQPVFDVFAGRIVITSAEATAVMQYTEAYDVRTLVEDRTLIDRLGAERPPLDLGLGDIEDDAGADPDDDGDEQQDWSEGRAEIDEARAPMLDTERLLWMVVEHVDPDAWMNFGGSRARIGALGDTVLVTATAMTHRRVSNALDRLRSVDPSALELSFVLVDVDQEELNGAVGARRPDRALLARRHVVLWQLHATTSIGTTYEARGTVQGEPFTLDVESTFDEASGLVRLRVNTTVGDDHVMTTLSLRPRSDGAVIELPRSVAGIARALIVSSSGR